MGVKLTGPMELHGGGRFVRPGREFVPAYVGTHAQGRLREKAEAAQELLGCCRVCPRNCRVNRLEEEAGFCEGGRQVRVSSAFAHFGEEDCLRGRRGSGTIFFSWCNLRCVFCQNYEISQLGEGRDVSARQLAEVMLSLQRAGCHNINFVTPTHVVPQLLESLVIAVELGLCLPLVYNTSAYDSLESVQLLEGVVDIYMPDFKLWDPEQSRKHLRARDYPEVARQVVKEMHRQVGDLQVDEEAVALRGVLVRHLVMPGLLEDTQAIMQFLARELSSDTFVNLMDQYHPAGQVGTEGTFSSISRSLTEGEFSRAVESARAAGLWRFDTRWRRGGASLADLFIV